MSQTSRLPLRDTHVALVALLVALVCATGCASEKEKKDRWRQVGTAKCIVTADKEIASERLGSKKQEAIADGVAKTMCECAIKEIVDHHSWDDIQAFDRDPESGVGKRIYDEAMRVCSPKPRR